MEQKVAGETENIVDFRGEHKHMAYYHEYKLYIFPQQKSWQARVYHMPTNEWILDEIASTADLAKEAAIRLAVLHENPDTTRDEIGHAKASLKWGHDNS